MIKSPSGACPATTTSYKSVEWYVLRRKLEQQREQAQLQIYEQAALLDKAQDAIMVHDLNWRSTRKSSSGCNWAMPQPAAASRNGV